MYNIVVFEANDKLLASYVATKLELGYIFVIEENETRHGLILHENNIYYIEDNKIIPNHTCAYESEYHAAQGFVSYRWGRSVYMTPYAPSILKGVNSD